MSQQSTKNLFDLLSSPILSTDAICDLIEKNKETINCRNKPDNSTPLHKAVLNSTIPVIECLLRNGADVNAADAGGFTPLQLAITCVDYEKAELLLKYGADRTISNKSGCNSYMMVENLFMHKPTLPRRLYDLITKQTTSTKTQPSQQVPSQQQPSQERLQTQERSSFLKKMWQSLSKEQADYHLKIMTTDEFNELRTALQQQ